MNHLTAPLLALLAASPAIAQETLWIDPLAVVDAERVPGTMVEVTVNAARLDAVRGVRFLVEYDPLVLEFLWHDPGTFTVLELTSTLEGVFEYSAVRGEIPATGAFSVVTLHFLVKAVGHTSLTLAGSPFEEIAGPVFVDKDFGTFPFDLVEHGFFSNDGTPAPLPSPTPTPSPSPSPTPTPSPEVSSSSDLPVEEEANERCGASAGAAPTLFLVALLLAAGISKWRAGLPEMGSHGRSAPGGAPAGGALRLR